MKESVQCQDTFEDVQILPVFVKTSLIQLFEQSFLPKHYHPGIFGKLEEELRVESRRPADMNTAVLRHGIARS